MQSRMDLVQLTGRYTVPQILVDDRPSAATTTSRPSTTTGRLDPLLGAGLADPPAPG